ncbi:MAG: hypothetical protein P8Y99_03150 [Calditrichaceae bacterium]
MKLTNIYIMLCTVLTMGFSSNMNDISKILPKTINNWYQSKEARTIDSTNIFDYMDGGGELYLGYRFNQLEVLEYSSKDKNTILVEIYNMDTGNDAFGLLSLDWSGDPVYFDEKVDSSSLVAPTIRALYGSGLLRLVSGNYFIRILAFRETMDAKNIVMQIGKILYNDFTTEPEIIQQIPVLDKIGWKLNSNKIAFFRSYMVFNSIFYLSHQNILNLDHSVNAITVSYDLKINGNETKPIQLLIIEYTSHQQAVDALNSFFKNFLPESKTVVNMSELQYSKNFKIEDGWLACKMKNNLLYIAFNIPDKTSADQIIDHIKLK